MTAVLLAAALYLGGSGRIDLPQGGSPARMLGGGSFRAGCYFDADMLWAAEASAAWMENDCSVGMRGLVHWQAWRVYGDLFGYSRFDPFFTLGVLAWTGRGTDAVGPSCGVGTFWHLDGNWSLRLDADATLASGSGWHMRYCVCAGLQYGF